MHKWLGMMIFPKSDRRTIRIGELKMMYAMVKRKKVSPVKCMINQWLEVFTLTGDSECTSLVTQIATNMGFLDNALVSFITEPHLYIDFNYFWQAYMFKKKEDGSIVMMHSAIQTRFRYLTRILVCMPCNL